MFISSKLKQSEIEDGDRVVALFLRENDMCISWILNIWLDMVNRFQINDMRGLPSKQSQV